MADLIIVMLGVASAFWIYFDAVKHRIGKDPNKPNLLNLSAGGWATLAFMFWPMGLPIYLLRRSSLIEKAKQNSVVPKNKTRSLLVLGVASLILVGLNANAFNDASYPTPEAFAERWNVIPPIHDRDDQTIMQIQAWNGCSGSNDHSCLFAQVCDGHASVHAFMDNATNSYTYVYSVNQSFSVDPINPDACFSGTQRLFNTLYDSPAEAQKTLGNFFGFGKEKISKNYSETVEDTKYDVRIATIRNAFVKSAMPSMGRDSTVEEWRTFMSNSTDVVILSKSDPSRLQP